MDDAGDAVDRDGFVVGDGVVTIPDGELTTNGSARVGMGVRATSDPVGAGTRGSLR